MNFASWIAIGIGVGAAFAISLGPGGFPLGIVVGVSMWLGQVYGLRRRRR
jgi:hypothetical protein